MHILINLEMSFVIVAAENFLLEFLISQNIFCRVWFPQFLELFEKFLKP